MDTARIERYGRQRINRRLRGSGCVVILVGMLVLFCGWLYVAGILMPFAFTLLGVDRIGETGRVFEDASPAPTVIVEDEDRQPTQITLDLGAFGQKTITNHTEATIVMGRTVRGTRAVTVSFSEPELVSLCAFLSEICQYGNDLYRQIDFDLHPGGGVVYVDVNAGLYWQRVGIVVLLDNTLTDFYIVGVDINGVMYNPRTLPFGLDKTVSDVISQVEREGNATLRELRVAVGDDAYILTAISIDETTLTLNLR